MGAASANRPWNGRRGKANHRRKTRADSVAARKPSSSGGTRHPKKSDSFLRQGGQVNVAWLQAEKANGGLNVAMASRLFGISRSQYYAEPKRQPSKRQQEDAQLSAKVSEIFHALKQRYGSPRIHNELKQEGIRTSRKRVIKHMKNNHLRARVFKRWVQTTDSQHGLLKPKNLVNRDFSATAPNQTWLGDVTYLLTPNGFIYLAVVLDVYSRAIVGWALGRRNDDALTCAALTQAIQKRKPTKGLIFHSDQGSTYAAKAHRKLLRSIRARCSMSRVGDCYDNAMMESWFSTLKRELSESFGDETSARHSLFEFIEEYYNRIRAHSSLGYFSPSHFENLMRKAD